MEKAIEIVVTNNSSRLKNFIILDKDIQPNEDGVLQLKNGVEISSEQDYKQILNSIKFCPQSIGQLFLKIESKVKSDKVFENPNFLMLKFRNIYGKKDAFYFKLDKIAKDLYTARKQFPLDYYTFIVGKIPHKSKIFFTFYPASNLNLANFLKNDSDFQKYFIEQRNKIFN